MIARGAAAVALAAIVTLSLLYLMQQLITGGTPAISAFPKPQRVDLVVVESKEPVEVQQLRFRPQRPPQPAARPGRVQPALDADLSVSLTPSVTAPLFQSGAVGSVGYAAVGDVDYRPLNRILQYPEQAIARDLEGYVILEYTVTPYGTVRDIHVIESSALLFESSAVKAALDFEYRPRVLAGEPVEVTGVMNKIVFRMDEPQQIAMRQ